jgi:hypothetical protein
VLVSDTFAYWGGTGPQVPKELRDFEGADLVAGRSHRSRFSDAHKAAVIGWLLSLQYRGFNGKPHSWAKIEYNAVRGLDGCRSL